MSKRQFTRTPNQPPPTLTENLLLGALPPADQARLLPTLQIVPLKIKAYLHEPGKQMEYVYFPAGGFCSIVTVLEDGSMVEVATVGREGMVGVTAATHGNPITSATMVQGESNACFRMTVDAFRAEMNAHGRFNEMVTSYTEALIGIIMQSTACNALHRVEQRLARWLLMAHDRMRVDQFPLTQEFAAMMLGAARPTVSLAAGTLQKSGLITYRHGRVTIVNRPQLEHASCECYRASTKLLAAVFTPDSSRSGGGRRHPARS